MVDAIISPTANSYISNADAILVWAADPYKQDYSTVDAEQDRSLKTATNILNDTYQTRYLGTITNAANALYFPRDKVTNPRTGVDFITTIYPDILARATALFAYYIQKTDRNLEIKTQSQGPITEKTLQGVGSFKYAAPTSVATQMKYTIPDEVLRVLSPLIDGGARNGYGVTIMGKG